MTVSKVFLMRPNNKCDTEFGYIAINGSTLTFKGFELNNNTVTSRIKKVIANDYVSNLTYENKTISYITYTSTNGTKRYVSNDKGNTWNQIQDLGEYTNGPFQCSSDINGVHYYLAFFNGSSYTSGCYGTAKLVDGDGNVITQEIKYTPQFSKIRIPNDTYQYNVTGTTVLSVIQTDLVVFFQNSNGGLHFFKGYKTSDRDLMAYTPFGNQTYHEYNLIMNRDNYSGFIYLRTHDKYKTNQFFRINLSSGSLYQNSLSYKSATTALTWYDKNRYMTFNTRHDTSPYYICYNVGSYGYTSNVSEFKHYNNNKEGSRVNYSISNGIYRNNTLINGTEDATNYFFTFDYYNS